MLSRGNTRWEGVFAELGKGEKNQKYIAKQKGKKALMSVSQTRCSKIKDHSDFSQGSISPLSF